MVICDQWPLMLLLKKKHDFLKAQMIASIFSNKVFLIKVCNF